MSNWFNLGYWLENFPSVRLNPADNAHVPARTLRVPVSDPYGPPIVAVEILPREIDHGQAPGSLDFLPIVSGVLSLVPVLGAATPLVTQILKTGLQIEHGVALKNWADSFRASPDEFSPQNVAAPFLVPMPLGRAQIMVSRPWYAPAMVYQFAEELRNGELRTTAEAYAAIVAAMVPPGASDPPAYTHGEAPLFAFVNPLATTTTGTRGEGEASQSSASGGNSVDLAPQPSPLAASPSPLPFIVGGALLLAGAPILVVLGAAAILAKK